MKWRNDDDDDDDDANYYIVYWYWWLETVTSESSPSPPDCVRATHWASGWWDFEVDPNPPKWKNQILVVNRMSIFIAGYYIFRTPVGIWILSLTIEDVSSFKHVQSGWFKRVAWTWRCDCGKWWHLNHSKPPSVILGVYIYIWCSSKLRGTACYSNIFPRQRTNMGEQSCL